MTGRTDYSNNIIAKTIIAIQDKYTSEAENEDDVITIKNIERVKERTQNASKAIPKILNETYIIISSIALGLVIFFSTGIYAAAARGFNGGIGGELILAVAVAVGLKFAWDKIKKKLD